MLISSSQTLQGKCRILESNLTKMRKCWHLSNRIKSDWLGCLDYFVRISATWTFAVLCQHHIEKIMQLLEQLYCYNYIFICIFLELFCFLTVTVHYDIIYSTDFLSASLGILVILLKGYFFLGCVIIWS